MQRDITLLLLENNLTDVANELANTKATSTVPLMWRLAVFARGGRRTRVRQTLQELAAAPDWTCSFAAGKDFVRRLSSEDLTGLRFYYERLCPDDASGAEELVRRWEQEGDLKELDSWLAARSSRDEWFMQRMELRRRLGTANELLEGLAAELRADPTNSALLDRYLRAAQYGTNHDVGWLANVFKMRLAFDYFELGSRLSPRAPAAAVPLLEKSLALSFTDEDAKLTSSLFYRGRSVAPPIKVNWEKQLRYWTKRDLAESYKALNQPLSAQPIVEELVNMKGDDFEAGEAHALAGAVQAASGQRVVETKILRDEVSRRETAAYWMERAQYYRGRDEDELELETYRQALVALPNNPRDLKVAGDRLQLVSQFAFFLGEREGRHEELAKLLTREFTSAPPDTDYAFRVAELITQSELELDDLRNSLLARQPALFGRLFDAHEEWGNSEEHLVEAVTEGDEVSAEQKKKIWSELERRVTHPGSMRAYTLAQVMIASKQWPRAITLLEGYIKNALPSNWGGYQRGAVEDLLNAYARNGDWRAAEKLVFAEKDLFWESLPAKLGTIAVAAEKQGATNDAIRLWRLGANLDRRVISDLSQLAQTSARPELLKFYSQMKKEDPESVIPDMALRLLQ